jgi:methylated-DNA-protein-cysteine methyltransferase-like protein
MIADSTYQRIYRAVAKIPRGRVATYGQIAEVAGIPRGARQVGYALAALREEPGVPWHRVINARGEISARSESESESLQRAMLEHEGIRFESNGRLSLERYRWRLDESVGTTPSQRRGREPRPAGPAGRKAAAKGGPHRPKKPR